MIENLMLPDACRDRLFVAWEPATGIEVVAA
jgi:hypothetical protein